MSDLFSTEGGAPLLTERGEEIVSETPAVNIGYNLLDVITMALKDVGVLGIGETPSPEDVNDALFKLNGMIAQWRRKRWLIYQLVDYAFVANGAQSYSIGPGGDFNVPSRPDRLESAFVRQINTSVGTRVDYPLWPIDSYEAYGRIVLKTLTSFPQWIFYDPGYPLGRVYPWPIPQASIYETHVLVKQTLPMSQNLSAQIMLPEEYIPALHYNLVLRLYPGYKQPPDPLIVALAGEALNVLRKANTAISPLTYPLGLSNGGRYNPYTDQFR